MTKILVVEDNVDLRFMLSEWLRIKELTVIEAASADEAVTVLSSILEVDLVVTDLEMPGMMNGFDLAQYIRKKYPALPIIMVSGRPKRPIFESVVTEFLQKPYDLEDLFLRIHRLLPKEQPANEKRGANNER